MINIKLSSDREFIGKDLEEAKEKYLNYHIEKGIEPLKIAKIFSFEDDEEEFEEEEFEEEEYSERDIRDVFEELEESLDDYRIAQEKESQGLRSAQQEISSYD